MGYFSADFNWTEFNLFFLHGIFHSMASYDWDRVGSILIKCSLKWNNCQPRQVPYTAGKIFGSYPEEDGGFSDLEPIQWGC